MIINEDFKNRDFSVAFTGHRQMEENYDGEILKKEILKQCEKGKKFFYVGMAIGFDTLCFHILEELRKTENIFIIASVPCREQSKNFLLQDKKEYERMLKRADKVVYVSEHYDAYCMMKRNRYMVDRASVLITYYRNIKGGTYATLKYAIQENLEIIYV